MWTTCTSPINSTYFSDDLSSNCFSLDLLTSHFYKNPGSIQDLPLIAWAARIDLSLMAQLGSSHLGMQVSWAERKETTSHQELPLSWE